MSDEISQWAELRDFVGDAIEKAFATLHADLAKAQAEAEELRDCGGVDGTIATRCGACLACLKAQLADAERRALMAQLDDSKRDELADAKRQLADAERVLEAARAVDGGMYPAVRDALANYDSKWGAGK